MVPATGRIIHRSLECQGLFVSRMTSLVRILLALGNRLGVLLLRMMLEPKLFVHTIDSKVFSFLSPFADHTFFRLCNGSTTPRSVPVWIFTIDCSQADSVPPPNSSTDRAFLERLGDGRLDLLFPSVPKDPSCNEYGRSQSRSLIHVDVGSARNPTRLGVVGMSPGGAVVEDCLMTMSALAERCQLFCERNQVRLIGHS